MLSRTPGQWRELQFDRASARESNLGESANKAIAAMPMADIKLFYAIHLQLNWEPVLWGPTSRELDAPLRLAEYGGVGEKLITVGYMSRDSKYIVHVATVGEISVNAGGTTGLVEHYS